MRAVFFLGDQRAEVREAPDPIPSEGQVVVALRASTICGSDLHMYRDSTHQRTPVPPSTAGHSAAGVVTATGPAVSDVAEGDRVSVYQYLGCGTCRYCRVGNVKWCSQRRVHGREADGSLIDLLKHLWIPALVLGTAGTAGLIRILRNNLLDELAKPYVVAARARGVPEWKLVLKYPVRMALNPFMSTIGYLLPFLLSGSVIVSVVLSLPTLGPTLLRALIVEDLYLASTIVLMLGILTVIGTLLSDILLVVFDPRIKIED